MIRLERLILKNQELVWFLSIVLNRDYFNACLPAGRRGKCFHPCISGMGTNIQRGWIMGSPAPTQRGPGNSLDARWGPFPPIQAGGSRAWALNVHPEKAKSWAAGAAPCKRGRHCLEMKWYFHGSLGQPCISPQALSRRMILQGWPPTWELRSSRTWLLWAQVLFIWAAPGPISPKLCAPPESPALLSLSWPLWTFSPGFCWRSNDVNAYSGDLLSSRGLASSGVTGSVFFFPWEAGSGTVDKGSKAVAATVSQGSLEAMAEWEDP